ncbi:MAG: hypothetical protein NZ992_07905 [Candidatus Korarchaeum sp.]|nr:hypothetical protein [Candidatus Korarchaeum sp.]MDW8035420.1 hypothetical protein [Candidatus Korarchaeum sp.]
MFRVIAPPSPDDVYESNVLVVVEGLTREDVEKVMRAVRIWTL